ncbi:MAG: PAS domain S-box protein [Magnetococcales bacterium]|nr:PAS domain S-box protein [Magnetococcales bacterium]
MPAFSSSIVDFSSLMPHGYCLLWDPSLLWLHVLSDLAIGLAYFLIPAVIGYFLARRRDNSFGMILFLFAAFILACGTTHFMNALTVWKPFYWEAGVVKLITAIVSILTAVVLFPKIPKILALPSLEATLKKLEHAYVVLRENQTRLKLAMEAGKAGTWEWDCQSGRVQWDETMQAIFGLTPGSFDGTLQHWWQRIHPGDREEAIRVMTGAVTQSGRLWHRYRIQGEEGRWRHVEVMADFFAESSGEVTRAIGMCLDVTEHQELTEALREARDRLQLQVDCVNRMQSRFIEGTDSRQIFEAMLLDLLRLTGSSIGFMNEVRHDERGEVFLHLLATANIARDETTRQRYHVLHQAGALSFEHIQGPYAKPYWTGKPVIVNTPINDPQDCGLPEGQPSLNAFLGLPVMRGEKVVGIIGLADRPNGYDAGVITALEPLRATCARIIEGHRDRQERYQAEHSLRLSEEQKRTIIEKSPFGIVVADDAGVILEFNVASEQLFGYTREEILGHPVEDLVPLEHREIYRTEIGQIQEKVNNPLLEGLPFEAEAMRRDGTLFPIRIALNRMVMKGTPSFVGLIANITEEKRLYSELIQSEKMAGLGTMVAGVAHEINTPVGIGVTAASELEERTLAFERMVRGDGISEEDLDAFIASNRRLASLIRGNLERAADLVRSFKAVAVDQSSEQLRTFKVREYIESAILTLQHDLRQTRISVNVHCPEDLEMTSYPGALSQIVINLVGNSRIHGFKPGDDGTISMTVVTEAEWVHLTYRDNGQGMSEETCRRIFEPFYTTRRDHGGSGLGMHIVYNLVTQTLGGSISCGCPPQEGALFQLRMPRCVEPGKMEKKG